MINYENIIITCSDDFLFETIATPQKSIKKAMIEQVIISE